MIYKFPELINEVHNLRRYGKNVGLITGSFDVIHYGHIQLFRATRKFVDFLVVGLDCDETIKISKGKDRPINNINYRLETVSEFKSIDAVFEIPNIVDYHINYEIHPTYFSLTKQLMINFLITNKQADRFWQEKRSRAQKLKINAIILDIPRPTSSTEIINKYLNV